MDDWNPDLYNRFRRYRAKPVFAILERLTFGGAERIIDLGCGSGENTLELARRSADAKVMGIDSSPAMIERARRLLERSGSGLAGRVDFRVEDIRELRARDEYTIVFSNAALQWVPGHREIFAACREALVSGGRIVVQMPANERETTQVTIAKLAAEHPWRDLLGGVNVPSRSVPGPEHYLAMLSELGFENIDCYYRTFEHPMDGVSEIVEWSRATTLRPFLQALPPREHLRFLAALETRLQTAYGASGELIFPYRRLFVWASRPSR